MYLFEAVASIEYNRRKKSKEKQFWVKEELWRMF